MVPRRVEAIVIFWDLLRFASHVQLGGTVLTGLGALGARDGLRDESLMGFFGCIFYLSQLKSVSERESRLTCLQLLAR